MSSRRSNSLTPRHTVPRPTSLESMGEAIKAEALRLGFSAVGFARAGRVSPEAEARLRQWLDEGGNAGMHYMENWLDKRLDPRLLMPGLKTIVSVALNYAPARRLPAGEPQISDYALGRDYHDVVKGKLRQLAQFAVALKEGGGGRRETGDSQMLQDNQQANVSLQSPVSSLQESNRKADSLSFGEGRGEASKLKAQSYRVFCDTGPVLERYWAVQAGLGWIGRNHQLIIPFAGSKFFLGELFLDFELPYDHPMPDRCGRCHKCIDACPTGALGAAASLMDEGDGRQETVDRIAGDGRRETGDRIAGDGRRETGDSQMLQDNRQANVCLQSPVSSLQEANHKSQISNLKSQSNTAQSFDASLCLSYQTIENRGELSEAAKAAMGDTFYGCDRCQAACPWNRFAKPNTTPELQPGDELLHMTRDKWKRLTVDDYRRLFKGSAVKRAKYDGLMRNIRNLGD